MAEWSKAADLKSVGPGGPGGSNPSPSSGKKMFIQDLSFKNIVDMFTSLGPHKVMELSKFSGVSNDVVSQWSSGTARPDPSNERRIHHYLVTKLADINQIQLDHAAQGGDLEKALAKVNQVIVAWDTHINSMRDSGSSDDAIEKTESDKDKAVSKMRSRLGVGAL